MTPQKSDPKIGLISNGMISSGYDLACLAAGEKSVVFAASCLKACLSRSITGGLFGFPLMW